MRRTWVTNGGLQHPADVVQVPVSPATPTAVLIRVSQREQRSPVRGRGEEGLGKPGAGWRGALTTRVMRA